MFLITSRALDTDWFSFALLVEFVHVTFGAGLPVAEQLTMTSSPSITSNGEVKLLVICGGTIYKKYCENCSSFTIKRYGLFKHLFLLSDSNIIHSFNPEIFWTGNKVQKLLTSTSSCDHFGHNGD